MKKKRVLFICLVIVLLCVTAFSSFATDFSSIGGSKGYIHATCSLEKKYHKSTYNTTREKHGLYTTIKRTSSYASTAIPTASSTSCYVYTAVYKNNGTATGVYYDSHVEHAGSGSGCPREVCKEHARPSSGRPQEPRTEHARPRL